MLDTAPIPFDLVGFPYNRPISSPGVAARLFKRWQLWRQRRRWIAEMTEAAALGRLDEILTDIGMTHADLKLLIDAPVDAGQQFEQLAEMEHGELTGLDPSQLREATLICARCECREPCKRWLRTGVWDGDGDQRCPNAALIHH